MKYLLNFCKIIHALQLLTKIKKRKRTNNMILALNLHIISRKCGVDRDSIKGGWKMSDEDEIKFRI